MARYIIKRLLALVIILLCVAVIIFSILYVIPSDPLSNYPDATEEQKAALLSLWGLDKGYFEQLGKFLFNTFLKFDLGTTWVTDGGTKVSAMFAERLPRTLGLGLICLIVNIAVGIPLGIVCATHQNRVADRVVSILAMIGVAIPGFVLAYAMMIVFSVNLNWLPSSGIEGRFPGIAYWVMPVIAGSIGGIANNLRMTRSSVLETIRADFVTTAKAKGLSKNVVTYKHMLPNAMIPILSQLGGQFAMLISGTVIIERVFSFPGIGLLLMTAITNSDYPLVRGCVLILAIFAAVSVLLVDLAYGLIDPRIKAQYVSAGKRRVKKHG